MSTYTIETTASEMLGSIKETFAEVTRYPLDILDENASLEEDLGIDSVKLGEVFSVLREKYGLPEHIGIPPEQLKTIAGISTAISAFLGVGSTPTAPQVQPIATPVTQAVTNTTEYIQPTPQPTAAPLNLSADIIAVFESVTRYPAEILDPNANLEEDLGIDSVKLGEVFSVLREKFGLPEHIGIPPEKLKSIFGITEAIEEYLAGHQNNASALPTPQPLSNISASEQGLIASAATPTTAPAQAPTPVAAYLGASSEQMKQEILTVFAEVTRYPAEILDPQANLEEDLGIDSVKLGEVFSVLREKYSLPEHIGIEPDQMKTIEGISTALANYLGANTAAPVTAPTPSPVVQQPSRPVQEFHNTPQWQEQVNMNQHVSNGNGNGHSHGNGNGYVPNFGNGSSYAAASSTPRTAPVNYRVNEKPFEGKVAFISGSGRGLGKEIADYLASLGATVIVNSFHSRAKGEQTAQDIINQGGKAMHVWGSMANPEHVHAVFDEIESTYGGLDFFIANASNGMLAKLEDLTVEHWEKAYRTNVIGLHQGALRAVELMKRRGGGKIITLSSPASGGYVDYFGCMGTVKAAVESLTRSLAIEMAKYNIQVNCVSPGPIYGELLNKWPESERLIKQWEDNTAYDRLCEAKDVSHFIAYLLGEEVKIFTGSVLVMDGGISSQGW